jgi:hypothetical protein
MLAFAREWAMRIGAQRFQLRARALELSNDLAIALPGEAQAGVLGVAEAIKAAAPRFVFALDALVMQFNPVETLPEELLEPNRLRLVGRAHSLFRSPELLRRLRYKLNCYSCVAACDGGASRIARSGAEPRRARLKRGAQQE